jgi:integrase
MNAPMKLCDYLHGDYVAERAIAAVTIGHYEWTIKSFGKFLGHEPTFADLHHTAINRWLVWLENNGCKPPTVKSYRVNLLSLWRAAFDAELIDVFPRRIRKIRLGRRNPVAWRPEEVEKLCETADNLRGVIRKLECAKRFYWGSLFRAVWDTALRRCDLSCIKYADIQRQADGGGLLIVEQVKTGDDVIVQFSADTMQAVDRMMRMSAPRELCWPLYCGKDSLGKVMREIVAEAGVRRGTFKWFRRSSITARERIGTGLGMLAAGHATPDMARRHYIDRSQLAPVPLPPALNVTSRPAASIPERPAPPIGVVFTTTLSLGGDQ